MGLTDPAYLRGIATLEHILAALTPKETALLPNYPNPFNPETWIPYHLANDTDVQISIYDINGAWVRQSVLRADGDADFRMSRPVEDSDKSELALSERSKKRKNVGLTYFSTVGAGQVREEPSVSRESR